MARTLIKLLMLPLLFVASTFGDEVSDITIIVYPKRGVGVTAPPTVQVKGDLMIINYVSKETTTFTVYDYWNREVDSEEMNTDGTDYIYDLSGLMIGSYTIGIENVKVAYTGSYIKEY